MKKTKIFVLALALLLALSACNSATGDRVGDDADKTQHPSNQT